MTALVYCALPPTPVVGGFVLAAHAAEADGAGQLRSGQSPAGEVAGGQLAKKPADQTLPASSSLGFSSDSISISDAAAPPLADIEHSELARARTPLNSTAARILAEGNARMAALAAAADALPNRRDIRMGAINADERLALAAQLYRPVVRYHEDGAPAVTVLLRARPEAGSNISQALRSTDLVQLRLRLLQETAVLLQVMNARDPAENGAVKNDAGGNYRAGVRGSGNLGNVYRAPVGMHDPANPAKPGEHVGDARKNALDEAFSGCAGAGAETPSVATDAPGPDSSDVSLAAVVWTEKHWDKASQQLQALLQAQDFLEPDADGWLVPDGFLPRLEHVSARLPQSPGAWLLLAEAQLRRGLPQQSIASCDAALVLDSGLNRARYIRALGHWRLQQLALAESDLTSSLDDRHGFAAQGEDRARRLRARGTVRMQRRDMAGMCEDFGAACALGECEGLILARAQQYCLPSGSSETPPRPEARLEGMPAAPEGKKSTAPEAESSPPDHLESAAGTKEAKP
ncbi:MAG: hypothetical protein QM579_10145 [Desulfovibrio sp.]|uniref:hypothetical protein n=1 Tax=Desulfovibrio sp. TaxID=885 RepID=UPI0039E6B621